MVKAQKPTTNIPEKCYLPVIPYFSIKEGESVRGVVPFKATQSDP